MRGKKGGGRSKYIFIIVSVISWRSLFLLQLHRTPLHAVVRTTKQGALQVEKPVAMLQKSLRVALNSASVGAPR